MPVLLFEEFSFVVVEPEYCVKLFYFIIRVCFKFCKTQYTRMCMTHTHKLVIKIGFNVVFARVCSIRRSAGKFIGSNKGLVIFDRIILPYYILC